MDGDVLAVIVALAHWLSYMRQNRRAELYELAIRSIEDVDHEVSADLGDFLATAEMAAEYQRICGLLGPGTGQEHRTRSAQQGRFGPDPLARRRAVPR